MPDRQRTLRQFSFISGASVIFGRQLGGDLFRVCMLVPDGIQDRPRRKDRAGDFIEHMQDLGAQLQSAVALSDGSLVAHVPGSPVLGRLIPAIERFEGQDDSIRRALMHYHRGEQQDPLPAIAAVQVFGDDGKVLSASHFRAGKIQGPARRLEIVR